MTVSSTRGTELNIDTILTTGMSLSGVLDVGQPADEADLAFCRTLLDTITDEFQLEGAYARDVEFVEITMDPDKTNPDRYDLGSDVMDLIGDGSYIPAGESLTAASGETPVIPMDREEWQRLSKDSESQPTRFYLHRAAVPLQVRVWPTPTEAGTIRFQAQRLAADTYTGSDTVDMRQAGMQFLIWEIAHQFAMAKSVDVGRCSMLHKRAEKKRDRYRAFANQSQPNYMYYAQPSRWRK